MKLLTTGRLSLAESEQIAAVFAKLSLPNHLLEQGVKCLEWPPMCFEWSRWTPLCELQECPLAPNKLKWVPG